MRPRRRRCDTYGLPLTRRQREALAGVAAGGSNRRVAADLGIALKTVKSHLWEARQRLGASTTTHAVALMDDRQPGWRPRVPDEPFEPFRTPDGEAIS